MSDSKQIKASAGSGKTYEITRCFLDRVASSAKNGEKPQNEVLGEIIAITFTNAAACEMRERIINHLKLRALGKEDEDGPAGVFTPEAARSWLEYILMNPNVLNVRTIDSLLHLIVRTAALPLGLNPGYSPVFESEGLIRPYLERLFEQARAEGRHGQSHRLLQDAFAALPDTTKGFLAHDRILDRLKRILENILAGDCDGLADKEALDRRLAEMHGAVRQNAAHFLELTAELDWNKRARNAFEKLAGPLSAADRIAVLQQKSVGAAEAEALFKKGFIANNPLPQDILDAFADCRKVNTNFLNTGAVLDLASRSMPFVRLSQRILQDYRNSPESETHLLNSQVARTVATLLDGDGALPAPEALYRIGTKLRHFLIDEFQDTGTDQWQAIGPLVEEALAQGGSLIWVGDVKQSIYGWRGGNPQLFDTILPSGTFERQTLPCNWRTRKDLVDFNNCFFAPLADATAADDVLKHLFPAEFLEEKRVEARRYVTHAFKDAAQEIPDRKKNSLEGLGGFAEITVIDEATDASEELGADGTSEDRILALLLRKLEAIHERRPWSDIWILVRSNDQGQKAVSCLLENDIPVITENSLLLAKNPLIVQAIAFLRFLDDPDDAISFLTFVTGDIVAEKFATFGFLDTDFLQQTISSGAFEGLIEHFRKNWPAIWERFIEPFSNHSSIMLPYDIIAEWFDLFQVEERFPGARVFLRRFLEVLYTAEDSDIGTISTFLEFWDSDDQDEKVPMPTDVNAVRIMTIHKAKGLEAPVVILPWIRLEASPCDDQFVCRNCDGLKTLVPVRKALQPEYDDEIIKSGCESLNLLYVAFTRARDELYVFYTPPKKQDDPFETLAQKAGFSLPCAFGTPPLGASDNDADSDEAWTDSSTKMSCSCAEAGKWKPMRWLPRLKILSNFSKDASSTAKTRGTLLHACLEYARFTGDADCDVNRALQAGIRLSRMAPPPTAEEQKDIAATLAWFLSQPEAERWLNEGLHEQELMAEDGLTYRMDLLVHEDNGILVIDYKSGDPKKKDISQVRNYMAMLGNMTKAGHKTRALLAYLDQRAFMLVDQARISRLHSTYTECVHDLEGAP
ncbi:MAG: UvrD-helicase domain-containing protein [Desulfovibrio sp.]|nr:UvrD-helicase domain-containing protein [Desulfovibrio sp.]